jgi:Fe-S-cluster containining protein
MMSGHEVQVLCEAIPWPAEPAPGDIQAQNKRRRSFAALSGSMPVRVIVTLAAAFQGDCPNLMADMRCRNYKSRPSVCRIYPAEINPFALVQPAAKACPPQAWATDKPRFIRMGTLVDDATRSLIDRFRLASETDVGVKQRLCASLGLQAAAMSNEGFVVHAPGREALACALGDIVTDPRPAEPTLAPGLFVSDQQPTVEVLVEIGALAISAEEAAEAAKEAAVNSFDFVSLNPAR